ncbi:MAG: right-handed parallel beta-helix repeat-containing protein [Planctomycetes bacterium]|nr:right-handed parallel beta-helix repeat-containing protein [Planctomycetota bacterium]
MLLPFMPRKSKSRPQPRRLHVEQLEDRSVPATFTVSNLSDSGAGSLRQAILSANSTPGSDLINFSIAGSIRLASALPAITDTVDLAGRTAPGFTSSPVVQIDMAGFAGLTFNAGATGSTLRSLGIIDAGGAGVTVNASKMNIYGNFIGLQLNGQTAGSNGGNGITINASSVGNTIGGLNEFPNVISGNGGNGIFLNGSSRNVIQANFIGTDVTGLKQRSNQSNGIQIGNGAHDNQIGGFTPANPPGTKPDDFSGARPPEGNIISGNAGNGVLINGGATHNALNGNFIGTNATGVAAQGNLKDGVAIVNANANSLVGTQVNLDPFIFYNVVSGNHGNGLRVKDSNNTIIQANFFGLGSDDNTGVGNHLNGVLIEGSSRSTVLGGIIPLGNVIDANGQNGVVVQDTASGFYSENSFVGTAAFNEDANLGNAQDGFHITSTGGNILVRINVISRNGDDGIEVSGEARGVQLVQNIIGLNTDGAIARPNGDNGVEIGGNAHDIEVGGLIGGFSIIPVSTISSNGGYGVAFVGNAHNVVLNGARIGTDSQGLAIADGPQALGNQKGGVFIGSGAHSITVGSTDSSLETIIAGNLGNGITLQDTSDNNVIGTTIGLDKTGFAMSNTGDGIRLTNSPHNYIGGSGTGQTNTISENNGNGITLTGFATVNNIVQGNFIGTDPAGLLDRGNSGNGIQIANGANYNTLGGEISGNPPDTTPDKFSGARPPAGNLVSGNDGNGILINGASPNNMLYGNFVGTDATGIAPLGNSKDGVAIVSSNFTVMAGTLATQDPFVYYNVVGGNLGNGLRVNNSNNTIVQANFFGLGSDDKTPVGNLLNGVVFEGSSRRTTFGGPIPLGNVIDANGANGVVLQDTVGGFVASNNFTGVAAFSTNATLGNGLDGWHITATGGGIVLKIGNIIAENGDDGIEVSGNASGIQLVQDIIGLNTDGKLARPNGDNGIEIGGNAHGIVIGGPQTDFSVVPTATVSANKGYGIAVIGNAHDNAINFVHVGTNSGGIAEDPVNPQSLGNQKGGIYVGPGTKNTTIGSTDANFPTTISGNVGNGITIDGSSGNTVIGSLIGLGRTGLAVPNTGNGIAILSGVSNLISQNSISANALLGIDLVGSANNGQAAPVLTQASELPGGIDISGTLTSTPNTTFTLQFFGDTAATVGQAQGRYYLGSTTVTTNAAGLGTFTFNGTQPPSGSTFVTATATDPLNNTSEFSVGVALV